MAKESTDTEWVSLSGLSVKGKILLPIKKTAKQKEMAKVALKERTNLLEAAKNGNEEAIETLTIEDIDLYSQISRRILKEDVYSIIESCFMPCGIECDQYSVLGEILDISLRINKITEEEIYVMRINCNDLEFDVCINRKDLQEKPHMG